MNEKNNLPPMKSAGYLAAGPGPAIRGSIDGQPAYTTGTPSGQSVLQMRPPIVNFNNMPPTLLYDGLFCVWKYVQRAVAYTDDENQIDRIMRGQN